MNGPDAIQQLWVAPTRYAIKDLNLPVATRRKIARRDDQSCTFAIAKTKKLYEHENKQRDKLWESS